MREKNLVRLISLLREISEFENKYCVWSILAAVAIPVAVPAGVTDTQMYAMQRKLDIGIGQGNSLLSNSKDFLDQLGINLQITDSEGRDIALPGSELRGGFYSKMILISGERFIQFLEGLTISDIDDMAYAALSCALQVLTNNAKEYEISEPEMFLSLSRIIDEYSRLGFVEEVKTLKIYEIYQQKNCLKEYFLIIKYNLHKVPLDTGFGPSRWHIDMDPKNYERRWTEAIGVLNEMRNNPDASDIANDLEAYLVASKTYALDDLPKVLDKYKHYVPGYAKSVAQFRAILKRIKI